MSENPINNYHTYFAHIEKTFKLNMNKKNLHLFCPSPYFFSTQQHHYPTTHPHKRGWSDIIVLSHLGSGVSIGLDSFWYQKEGQSTSWFIFEFFRFGILSGPELRSLIVRYHMISCTSQLSAKHIWTLHGYVDLMRGMPINAPI